MNITSKCKEVNNRSIESLFGEKRYFAFIGGEKILFDYLERMKQQKAIMKHLNISRIHIT